MASLNTKLNTICRLGVLKQISMDELMKDSYLMENWGDNVINKNHILMTFEPFEEGTFFFTRFTQSVLNVDIFIKNVYKGLYQ